jgi:outer membrane scaffolding protein for murein synthesis (MipA/OmpV family)
MLFRPALILTGLLAASLSAQAADTVPESYERAPASAAVGDGADLIFEFGLGGQATPAYEGSDEYILSPFPIISLDYLRVPGLFEIGGGENLGGVSFGPYFRFVDERSVEEFEELVGLENIDRTYEIGLKASYEFAHSGTYATEIYGASRYALGGAEGFIGEVGANAVWRPMPVFELKAGPVISVAASDYMDTYFSVSPAEALASGGRFDNYEAGGGFKSVGAKIETRYEFHPDLFLTANAEYQRLIGDAADSPITDAGSENQFFFGVGLSKRFSFDLF